MFRNQDFHYTLRPPLLGPDADRRIPVRHAARLLRALRIGLRLPDARSRRSGARGRRLPGRRVNPVDGYLTVRQSDAHAWAEIWLAGKAGCVSIRRLRSPRHASNKGSSPRCPRVSPAGIIRLDADWLRQLRNRWEAANNTWNQWVLGYNPQRQREVLSRLGLPTPTGRA
jgi:hypothetical protein